MYTEQEVKQAINITAAKVVNELNEQGLLITRTKTAYQKMESLLYNYRSLKLSLKLDKEKGRTEITRKFITTIDKALDSIKDDPYFEVISMIYIDGKTREDVACELNCDEKTVTRNKERLVNMLKVKLFSDDYIMELLNA